MSNNLSLDRIRILTSHLPPYTRPTVHIAGTNGKGSVAALVSSILIASTPPLFIGRFNSPHLVSIYDCITLDNEPVAPATYAAAREEVERMDQEHEIGASSFELLTSTALVIFEHAKVDVVVLEAGMGGRLDATNVVPDECVLVSALTAVDLDHQAFLGSTVELIAKEKAAIARNGRPFVLGPQRHKEVRRAVERVINERGSLLLDAEAAAAETWMQTDSLSVLPPPSHRVTLRMPALGADTTTITALLPLQGAHQLDNLGVAAAVLDAMCQYSAEKRFAGLLLKARITPRTVADGIRTVHWPGRLSYHTIVIPAGDESLEAPTRKVTLLVDGAHNPASSLALARHISDVIARVTAEDYANRRHPFNLTYILALSHSPPKMPYDTLRPLLPLPASSNQVNVRAALLRFSPPEGMHWVKAVPPSELRGVVQRLAGDIEVWAAPDDGDPDPEELRHALKWASDSTHGVDGDSLVVVAGSLYLVADLYRLPYFARSSAVETR